MSDGAIQCWFDFASPYSYLAVPRVERLAGDAGLTVEWKPFLLGPIFREQGWSDSPFNLYPAKGRYMWRDMERLCEKLGLPFQKPTQFPRSSVLAGRVACLLAGEPSLPAFLQEVFRANFVRNEDIGAPGVIERILGDLGQDGRAVIDRAEGPEHKGLLRRQTEQAAALGIFGAPSFIAAGELFWGNDRLPDAIAWCREKAAP